MTVREIYDKILRRILKKTFPIWRKLGFHITPNHFYSPVPDRRTLKNDVWDKHSEMPGININADGQLNLLSTFFIKNLNKSMISFRRVRPQYLMSTMLIITVLNL